MMGTSFDRRMVRLIVVGVAALIAIAAWATASGQSQPPFLLYGDGAAGDTIAVYDADGVELGTTTVDSDGTWHVNVQCDSDEVKQISFTRNGSAVAAEIEQTGEDQASVTLSEMSEDAMMTSEDEMMSEDDELTSEDEMMSEDEMEADSMMEEEQAAAGYPESGSGGLADEGPSTSALVGTILVLVALAVGVGVWKVRGRV